MWIISTSPPHPFSWLIKAFAAAQLIVVSQIHVLSVVLLEHRPHLLIKDITTAQLCSVELLWTSCELVVVDTCVACAPASASSTSSCSTFSPWKQASSSFSVWYPNCGVSDLLLADRGGAGLQQKLSPPADLIRLIRPAAVDWGRGTVCVLLMVLISPVVLRHSDTLNVSLRFHRFPFPIRDSELTLSLLWVFYPGHTQIICIEFVHKRSVKEKDQYWKQCLMSNGTIE